jgi:hypothetical protein
MNNSTLHLGSPQHFFIPHKDATQLNTVDTASALAHQAHAAISALMCTFNDEENNFNLAPTYVHSAMWAIQSQLELLQLAIDHNPKQGAK